MPAAVADGRRWRRNCAVEIALMNLTDTAAKGGAVPAVLDALQAREQDRRRLVAELERLGQPKDRIVRLDALRAELRAYAAHWARLLDENRTEARPLLDTVLDNRIGFEPLSSGGYQLHVPIAFDKVLIAAVPAAGVLQDRMVTRAGIEPAAL